MVETTVVKKKIELILRCHDKWNIYHSKKSSKKWLHTQVL